MLGQDDVQINDDTGEVKLSDDPRAFTNKPVRQRMIVVSAGVIFNMLFAILAFMCVFMVGRFVVAPSVSVLDAASPAARAGVVSGDEVVEVNGRRVDTYHDLLFSVILAKDGVARLKVRRGGKILPDELVMQFDESQDITTNAAGLTPAHDDGDRGAAGEAGGDQRLARGRSDYARRRDRGEERVRRLRCLQPAGQ